MLRLYLNIDNDRRNKQGNFRGEESIFQLRQSPNFCHAGVLGALH